MIVSLDTYSFGTLFAGVTFYFILSVKGFSLHPLTNSGNCGGKLLFLGCESISFLVEGLRIFFFFGTSTSRVFLINFINRFWFY